MNIFFVDADPIKSAKMLADDHIRKMQIESAQMLCAAHWLSGNSAPYKLTHKNHPSTIWVRQSIHNYRWLVKHGLEICNEFEKRYGKLHKTKSVIEWCQINEPNLPNIPFFAPPQCMPIEYKHNDVIIAYRTFYVKDKVQIKKLKWSKLNNEPNWLLEYNQ